ncbi:hypothetical protein HK096_006567 [Nowakowskiella sp. JEL0078]|nr:hypothetical protein HK096_006567 [Nowakowskiella sp. JEL0078]
MEYIRLGNTGLKVSKICLGCMGYGTRSSIGSPEWMPWVLGEEDSIKLIKAAYDAGINFWDTADVYSNGKSEIVIGKALKLLAIPRERVIIATKLFGRVSETPSEVTFLSTPEETTRVVNQAGLSRKHIFEAVEKSLQRLGTDYIDLYQIHRWDYNTPIEETMEALNDLVRLGKVRYIGRASSMYAWQFAKANHAADKNGWAKFVSMQNYYNAIYREEEREMLPFCKDSGVGVIPWSPLAQGVLTGRKQGESTRSGTAMAAYLYSGLTESDKIIIERVQELAKKISERTKSDVTSSQVATAWILGKDVVTAPIIGISKLKYLEDAVASLKLKLTDEEIKYIEEPYKPKNILYH